LKADQFRKDLSDAGVGTGRYGFLYAIPADIKDGKPHSIKVRVEKSSYELEFYKTAQPSITCQP
jgi:hypothetical protein